ncbi:MAG: hypothetical protein KDK34_15645, partial [Leptospiraceae bacterium]|nr:hypothetical protein [Leptospiraceae bacterium]
PLPWLDFNRELVKGYLSGFLFVDHGATVNIKGAGTDNTLLSAGAGIQIPLTENFNAQFVVGVPLADDTNADIDDVRFHFFAQYRF